MCGEIMWISTQDLSDKSLFMAAISIYGTKFRLAYI